MIFFLSSCIDKIVIIQVSSSLISTTPYKWNLHSVYSRDTNLPPLPSKNGSIRFQREVWYIRLLKKKKPFQLYILFFFSAFSVFQFFFLLKFRMQIKNLDSKEKKPLKNFRAKNTWSWVTLTQGNRITRREADEIVTWDTSHPFLSLHRNRWVSFVYVQYVRSTQRLTVHVQWWSSKYCKYNDIN